jgi:hypothetical protein
VRTSGPARIVATASVEASADGGDNDSIVCWIKIGGTTSASYLEDIAHTMTDTAAFPVSFARRVPDAGIYPVELGCGGDQGSPEVEKAGLAVVAVGE